AIRRPAGTVSRAPIRASPPRRTSGRGGGQTSRPGTPRGTARRAASGTPPLSPRSAWWRRAMADVWAAVVRRSAPYHRITGERAGLARDVVVLEMACKRHTVEGRGERLTAAEARKAGLKPCVR